MHDVFRVAETSRICMIFSLVKVRTVAFFDFSFFYTRVVAANEFTRLDKEFIQKQGRICENFESNSLVRFISLYKISR